VLNRNIKGERLATPIRYVKGVGPAISRLLEKKGIKTIEDALYFLPLRYEDRRKVSSFSSLNIGDKAVVVGDVLSAKEYGYRWRKVFQVILSDGTGLLKAVWYHYNRAYFYKVFEKGKRFILYGEVKNYRGEKQVAHPDYELLGKVSRNPFTPEGDSLNFGRLVPIYSEVEGVYPGTLRRIMKYTADCYSQMAEDILPPSLRSALHLMELPRAFYQAHFPDDAELASRARHRLIFDEFFLLELGLGLRRRGAELEKGIAMPDPVGPNSLCARLRSILPFSFTSAQEKALDDIRKDMAKPHPMNRLLQGDVGCGKTIVALCAALTAVDNGHQVGIMAPTEILSEQHYLTIKRWTEPLGLRSCLITSDLRGKERDSVISELSAGRIDIAVGTHAVIQEGVDFKTLGLGIIDEQHRFGVIQRSLLKKKGFSPHILVMTATPIPRTLAMTLYGDLDLTVIDEMPPGRKNVETHVLHEREREKAYKIIREEIRKGRQAFIVYPLVEESEKLDLKNAVEMHRLLQSNVFPDLRVGLLHGRMSSEEKEETMLSFKEKKVDILACTTVIEVGIDIPNATIMMVEHAERFGLSQLHQLRGRIGRGEHPSQCLLLSEYKKSDDARRRLAIMEKTHDGFKIAEEDLDIRGPGEFFGTRQSGLPDFRVGHILRDSRILAEARQEAFALLEMDPGLENTDHRLIRAAVAERWKGRLELGTIA